MKINGERILIFGDSLSAPRPFNTQAKILDVGPAQTDATSAPGEVLARALLARGAQAVRINARIGRSARGFMVNEGAIDQFARDRQEFKPTTVLVWLGTNDIDIGTTPTALASTADAMASIRDAYRGMGAKVFALGPPSYNNARYAAGAPAMLTTIQKTFGADRTLDVRSLTPTTERTGDGVHFTVPAAQTAGANIAQALPQAFLDAPVAVATGMSNGAKFALGALSVASVVGLSWLALRAAKHAAQRPELGRRTLEAVDVKLIKRVAQLISYDVSREDIHDQLITDGYTEDDIFQAHQAAKVYLRRRELPDSNYGRAFRFGLTVARHFARRR